MTARIIDGNALSAKLRGELAGKAAALTAQGTQPCLAVILVGGDPASAVYVRNKVAGCEKAGIKSLKFEYPQDVSPADVLGKIAELNADPSVHGGLGKAVYAYPVEHLPTWQRLRRERGQAGEHRRPDPVDVGPGPQAVGLAILLRGGKAGRIHRRQLGPGAGERLAGRTEIE